MSCMIYFHKILLQNFFITHYLLNTVDICDLKQFYLLIILKIKKFINILVRPIYIPHCSSVIPGVTYTVPEKINWDSYFSPYFYSLYKQKHINSI